MQADQFNLTSDQQLQPVVHSQEPTDNLEKAQGRWDEDQHHRFLEGLFKFGKNWKEIQNQVLTRSCSQVRSHAQKYFIKLQKIIKDRKKQKNKSDIELTDIEKQILQNFTINDITPNSPEVLVCLLQNSCLVPNIKVVEKNNVTGNQQKINQKKGFKKVVRSKDSENQRIDRNKKVNSEIHSGGLIGSSTKNESILDLYYDQEQDESKSFFCRLMQNNAQHFRQGRDFTQFIDFVGKHNEMIHKPQEMDSAQTSRNRRSSFTLVQDQQNDLKLKQALDKIRNGQKIENEGTQ